VTVAGRSGRVDGRAGLVPEPGIEGLEELAGFARVRLAMSVTGAHDEAGATGLNPAAALDPAFALDPAALLAVAVAAAGADSDAFSRPAACAVASVGRTRAASRRCGLIGTDAVNVEPVNEWRAIELRCRAGAASPSRVGAARRRNSPTAVERGKIAGPGEIALAVDGYVLADRAAAERADEVSDGIAIEFAAALCGERADAGDPDAADVPPLADCDCELLVAPSFASLGRWPLAGVPVAGAGIPVAGVGVAEFWSARR
jgi:hypothetical protein